MLVVDSGANEEVVSVLAVGSTNTNPPYYFDTQFQKPHAAPLAIRCARGFPRRTGESGRRENLETLGRKQTLIRATRVPSRSCATSVLSNDKIGKIGKSIDKGRSERLK